MLRSCNATNFVGIVHFLPQIVKGIRLNYRFMLKIKQLLLCSCFLLNYVSMAAYYLYSGGDVMGEMQC